MTKVAFYCIIMTMHRYIRIKNQDCHPQSAAIIHNSEPYFPIVWHTATDQDKPIGSKSTFSEHTHDYYHIVIYTKGKGFYSRDGAFEPAEPGQCVLIHPGQKHDFISRMKSAVYSEITFSYQTMQNKNSQLSFNELLSKIAGTECILKKHIVLPRESQNTFNQYITQITDYLNSSHPKALYNACWTLEHIFNYLIDNCCSQENSAIADDRITQVKIWIEQNYIDNLSMDDLAKKAGLSKGYFFRAFKKSFEIAPLAYQQKLRIEAAKTLLRTTSLRCNEIAYRVGFNDVYFFHRIFKKLVGLTPNHFRKPSS